MKIFNKEDFTVKYQGESYQVHISRRKKMKNIYFRLNNKIINVSCNYRVSKKRILFQLNYLMPELLKKDYCKNSIKYYDDNGELIDNPFVSLLVNERKVKLLLIIILFFKMVVLN